jgi:hypothetical protein
MIQLKTQRAAQPCKTTYKICSLHSEGCNLLEATYYGTGTICQIKARVHSQCHSVLAEATTLAANLAYSLKLPAMGESRKQAPVRQQVVPDGRNKDR